MATWLAIFLGVALVAVLYTWPEQQAPEQQAYIKPTVVVDE